MPFRTVADALSAASLPFHVVPHPELEQVRIALANGVELGFMGCIETEAKLAFVSRKQK